MVVMVSEYTAVRSNNCSKRSKMVVILQQDLIEQYGNHKVVLLRNDTQDIWMYNQNFFFGTTKT
jgi:hypothetical protein